MPSGQTVDKEVLELARQDLFVYSLKAPPKRCLLQQLHLFLIQF